VLHFTRSGNACPAVRSFLTTWLTSAAIAIASAAPASAQDTRADEIAAKQREKAASLSTYHPSRAESFLLGLEANFASPPNGFYPEFGSIYQGGGFSLGPGYRRFFARDAVWTARALYSIKNYKQVEIGTRTPWFTNGRWTVDARLGWLDAPQVAYFGQGMADVATRANFTLQQTYATALAEVRPTRWTRLSGEVSYDDYTTKSGRGSAPSIETIYNAEFRWIPNRTGLDIALFYDAGKVTSRREDLDFDSLKSDWGIGARFHGPTTTVLRIEGAKGTDGWRLVVSTGAAF
jgi:hypothetical protein